MSNCVVLHANTRAMDIFNAFKGSENIVIGTILLRSFLSPTWLAFVREMRSTRLGRVCSGYNVIVAMRIIGRPDKHALLFFCPDSTVLFFERSWNWPTRLASQAMTTLGACSMCSTLNLGLSEEEEYEAQCMEISPSLRRVPAMIWRWPREPRTRRTSVA